MNSQMQIEVVNVNVSTQPTAKGSYQVADVAYKNKSFQDKLEGKKVMDFASKVVFDTLTKAKFGEVFNITRVKNEKGFWDWIAANADVAGDMAGDQVPAGPAAPHATAPRSVASPAPKSNYETAEERAARQILIVRQSSVSSAVELAVASKVKDPQEVLTIARQFENFVFGRDEPQMVESTKASPGSFDDMTDDIPY